MIKTQRNFVRYAWFVLIYTLFVILWGAFVRATGSGAGCGSHWPTCNGEIIPRSPQLETIIEFTHRLSSGLLGFLMLGLLIWVFLGYQKGHPARRAALWSFFFVMTEALIGAGIVRFEWVATNVSVARVITMAFHLVNTFILLGAMTLTTWFAAGHPTFRIRRQGVVGMTLMLALAGTLILGASGAITALGDTLYLNAGITPEQSPLVARLVSVRIVHPILAFALLGIFLLSSYTISTKAANPRSQQLASLTIALYIAQLLLGALNVYLKAPVSIQLAHLLLSDLIWITLIWLTATTFSYQQKHRQSMQGPTVAQNQSDISSPIHAS